MNSDTLRVTFLGTGTSVGIPVVTCSCDVCTSEDVRNKRLRASILLEWMPGPVAPAAVKVLVDTSTDLRQQALRARIDRVDAVLYTHAHADHILGIDELRMYNYVHRRSIPLYGNEPTLTKIQQMFAYAFAGGSVGVPQLTVHEIGDELRLLGTTIQAIPVRHGEDTTLAFRIGNFGYVTDCNGIPPESAERLQGLDVLVLDTLRRRPHRSHFGLDEALDEVERLRPASTYLTHLSHDLDHAAVEARLPSGVKVAHDGLVLEIPLL
jgi:phosphoribosyl 1,2-cyclic phosphate phosphodiesterase